MSGEQVRGLLSADGAIVNEADVAWVVETLDDDLAKGYDGDAAVYREHVHDVIGALITAAQHLEAGEGAHDLSISLAWTDNRSSEPRLGDRHHVYSDGARLYLSVRGHGLVHTADPELARVEYDGGGVLRRGSR